MICVCVCMSATRARERSTYFSTRLARTRFDLRVVYAPHTCLLLFFSNMRFGKRGIPTFPSQTRDAVGYAWFLFPIAIACSDFRSNQTFPLHNKIVYIAYCCAMLYSNGSFTTTPFSTESNILSYRLSLLSYILFLSFFHSLCIFISVIVCCCRRRRLRRTLISFASLIFLAVALWNGNYGKKVLELVDI